jgi:hypothetical protein
VIFALSRSGGYFPTGAGNPGAEVLSPGRPLGFAPVPIVPGVDMLGAPGWLAPPGFICCGGGGGAAATGGGDGGGTGGCACAATGAAFTVNAMRIKKSRRFVISSSPQGCFDITSRMRRRSSGFCYLENRPQNCIVMLERVDDLSFVLAARDGDERCVRHFVWLACWFSRNRLLPKLC